ncbi:MAG: zinc-binding protein [Spirochaetaceae bacterium]|mgnify:CR=1 FL=1|nr:zinc-binding protein [Spirochaetaceae bacterium]|tara:strand:- start:73398 stop:73838 length:441 start_codon:yes stop_codon:yes gene_type:complete
MVLRDEDSSIDRRATLARYRKLPLVYSCSGCSSAAQLANDLALRADREELAEMSCIAGVGAGVQSLVHTASSGRPILVLDGCPLHCARLSLKNRELQCDVHIDLSRHGIRKRYHESASDEEREHAWNSVVFPAASELMLLSLGSEQ